MHTTTSVYRTLKTQILHYIVMTDGVTGARALGVDSDNLGVLDIVGESLLGVIRRVSRRVELAVVSWELSKGLVQSNGLLVSCEIIID